MAEAVLAWILLVSALITNESLYYVASAGFAIAAQISRIVDKIEGDGNG